MTTPSINVIGLAREQLADAMNALGEPAFRVKQLWHWIYFRGVTDFEAMTSLPKAARRRLAEIFTLARPQVVREQQAQDGTRKWLFRFEDGNEAETVFIPEDDRGAVCMSSQVGCTLTCSFCHTGTQKLVRNLSPGELVQQVMVVRDAYGEWPAPPDRRMVSNVVLMGMGEPLFNYDNVAAALRIVMDPEGLAMSRRRITLSTSGVVPMMRRVGQELGVKLAVSLHAATDDVRDVLVPINKKYPIQELMQACRTYPGADNARRITFEYVMLKGINDQAADARALMRLVAGIPCKFNLIPFNPWPGAVYECSSNAAMTRFAKMLNDAGYSAPIRAPRGRDILAACGQLKSLSERVRLSRLNAARAAAQDAVPAVPTASSPA